MQTRKARTGREDGKGYAMSYAMTRHTFVSGLAAVGLTASAGLAPMVAKASETSVPDQWDYEYDVVVCGAGGSGLIAALKASDAGLKVLSIDANYDTGGHACVSSGVTHFGCGTQYQIDHGIDDSPERYYLDHTRPDCSDSRFNDPEIIREAADRMVECYDWCVSKGLKLQGDVIDKGAGDCETVNRSVIADGTGYINIWSGTVNEGEASGVSVTRPFEESARAQGVDFMMNRHMDALIQDDGGRVVGIRASYTPRTLPDGSRLEALNADGNIDETRDEITVKAAKAVIVATGGGSSNVAYRTMFNPTWGEQMDGTAGEPYSFQDASGEVAGLAIGAGLSSAGAWTYLPAMAVSGAARVGCRYTYAGNQWTEGSPVWDFVGAKGVFITSWDGCITVNMLGERFGDEYASNHSNEGYAAQDKFVSTALGSAVLDRGTDHTRRVGGPIWAIFDSAYAKAQRFDLEEPNVDITNGYFFSGETLEELASNIVNKYYEDYPMDPETLVATVNRYNEMVDVGVDADFGKPSDLMTQKIETGPFYAAWAVPCMHDCLAGLRTNGKRQVLDVAGEVIPGLYACGECSGGHRTHGLGKVEVAGYIAGMYASEE